MQGLQNRSITIISLSFLILPFIFLLLGCNIDKGGSRDIENEIGLIMDLRERGINEKDLGLYMSCVSRDYKNDSETFDIIKEKMQKNFEIFEKIKLSTSNRTIYPDHKGAMVVQNYELKIFLNGEDEFINGKEKLILKKEDGEWKIVDGL